MNADLEVIEHQAPATLFGSDDPTKVIEKASKIADALKDVIVKKKLVATISGKQHVLVDDLPPWKGANGRTYPHPLESLFSRVQVADSGCWLWTGSVNGPKKPYGRIRVGGKRYLTHKLSYELLVGPVPAGLTLDHLCRNHRCVNPAHLEPVTNLENIQRGTQGWNMRIKTHCPQGHPYDEANTYFNVPKGCRMCRTCSRERMRARRAGSRG